MKKISVIGADLTAITGNGNPHDSNWVVVFSTDPLYTQLRETENGKEEKDLDETDQMMIKKGYTQYTFNDLEAPDEEVAQA